MSAGPLQRVLDVVRRQADPDANGPLADERLLARFSANGDPSAFELLVWRHGGLVIGTCRRLLLDAHLAEDAFQATFLALAKKPRAVRSGAALADWLHRVAVRVSNKLRIAATRRAQIERGGARGVAVPADDAGRKEWNDIVDHEIDRLPEHLRRTVVLCYLDGRTTEEAAHMLGCARGTIMSRLSKARERLRSQLTRRGVTLPVAGIAAFIATESPAALVPLAVRAALIETPPVLLAIVHGVFHAMTISKLKVATAVVLALGFAGTGVGWVVVPGPGPAVVVADEPPKVTKPPAQNPSSAIDGRIQELEAKIDRLTKALESRIVPSGPESPAVRILTEALDRLIAEKVNRSDAHAKFLKSAQQSGLHFGQNPHLTRLLKVEMRRSELRIEKADMKEKMTQFKEVKTKKGKEAAMKWVAMVGLKFALASIKDDSLETYEAAMEAKLSDCDMLLKSLDDMYEAEQKRALAYEAEVKQDQEFREEIGRLQAAITGVDKALREIGAVPAKLDATRPAKQ